MKSIHHYGSYRQFLRDFYEHQKRSSGLTYARFAKDAGSGSPNYLKMVMDGDRNLTVANIHQFARALRLDFDETAFFESLVFLEQASTPAERAFYRQRLASAKAGRPRSGRRTSSQEFVARWYVPAVIFALNGQPDSVDLDRIAVMVGIRREQLDETLVQLKKHSMLTIRDGHYGHYGCEATHLAYHDKRGKALSQKKFLREQIQRSIEAFDTKYESGAKFQSHTFTISAESFSRYEAQLNSIIERIIEDADADPVEQVAQLNLQFFTLERRVVAK